MRKMEIDTTIRSGLPVLAKGYYNPGYAGDRINPPERAHIEDLEIFWYSGHRVSEHLLAQGDLERVELEMLEYTR